MNPSTAFKLFLAHLLIYIGDKYFKNLNWAIAAVLEEKDVY